MYSPIEHTQGEQDVEEMIQKFWPWSNFTWGAYDERYKQTELQWNTNWSTTLSLENRMQKLRGGYSYLDRLLGLWIQVLIENENIPTRLGDLMKPEKLMAVDVDMVLQDLWAELEGTKSSEDLVSCLQFRASCALQSFRYFSQGSYFNRRTYRG